MTVKVTGFDFGQRNEGDAITRAPRGDAASFESLYKAHRQHVYHLCLGMLKNVAEAEDLTQQVFLQAFRKIGTFRGDSCFSTWLHRISVNAVLMHFRRKRPAQHLIENLDGDGTRVADQIDLTRTGTSAPDVIDRLNLKRAIRVPLAVEDHWGCAREDAPFWCPSRARPKCDREIHARLPQRLSNLRAFQLTTHTKNLEHERRSRSTDLSETSFGVGSAICQRL
jgi:RNA polymerase sigma factor (sigma-70 family)